jgi:hypothetical protein
VIERLDTTELELDPVIDRKRLWYRRFGELIYYFSEPALEMQSLEHRAYVQKARSPGSRLTEAEIAQNASYMVDVQEREIRRAFFAGRPIDQTFQGLMLPLVERLLARDPSVRSLVNVGAHFAYCDHVLAERHPQVSFLGVDFAPNLREFNLEFVRPNLDFRSGYALDLLESGELKPDAEVRRYMDHIAKSRAYMILNEPLYNLPGGGVADPDAVPAAESLPTYEVRLADNRPGPLCYTHNYRAIALAAGLEVLYYRVFRPAFTDLRMLQLIAAAPR